MLLGRYATNQQTVVKGSDWPVASEIRHRNQLSFMYLSHAAHDAELLCSDEALQHNPDGHVDVILVYVVTKMHASMSLSHANHGLNVSHRDWYASSCLQHRFI